MESPAHTWSEKSIKKHIENLYFNGYDRNIEYSNKGVSEC